MPSCKKMKIRKFTREISKTISGNIYDDQPLKSSMHVGYIHQESSGI